MAKGKFQKWLEPDGLLLLEGWARDGLTDEQIAANCGITASTLYAWKDKYSEISEALKRGKEVVDIQVENALLKRALGYRYDEVTREKVKDPVTGFSCLSTTKKVTKEVLPDITAQIFWLKNRRPDKWRDKPVDTSGEDKENNLLRAITDSAQEDLNTDDLPETE
ncbi:putative transposase [Oscillibacter valericigenes Sjm18-20]|nr:putative transposase [Oscillibacter valericigenes Sjm18-20]